MADSVNPVQTNQAAINQAAFNAATVQLAESTILGNAIDASNASVFNADVQAATDVSTHPAPNNADIGAEGLLGLNTTTLSLFNEIGSSHVSTDPENLGVTGNLSAQQLQELGILQQDVQLLEEASVLSSHAPLNENVATTLDLSIQAQGIAANTNIFATIGTTHSTPTNPQSTLTQEQLALTARIIAPFLNQPLTPVLLTQIQVELQANQINPIEISLSTLLLVQNYIASMQTVPVAKAASEDKEETEISVDPVSSVDAVAVEDSAIL